MEFSYSPFSPFSCRLSINNERGAEPSSSQLFVGSSLLCYDRIYFTSPLPPLFLLITARYSVLKTPSFYCWSALFPHFGHPEVYSQSIWACTRGVVASFLELKYSFSPCVDQLAFLLSCPHLDKGEEFHITPCYEGGFPFYFFPLEVPSFFPPS